MNKTLREQLAWQEGRFDKVRKSLTDKGIIKASAGQGGKTRFASYQESGPQQSFLKAFVSYTHIDQDMKNEFIKHLKPLEKLCLITNWHDRLIKPGDKFDEVISAELEKADIIFLLISIDFINLAYCYTIELARALERAKSGSVRIPPVILRDCLWQHSPFGKLQAIPRDAKPIASHSSPDEAFAAVAQAVHELLAPPTRPK